MVHTFTYLPKIQTFGCGKKIFLYILWSSGIFYGHLVKFVDIWLIFSIFVCCMYLEKSGSSGEIYLKTVLFALFAVFE
jgi:hypothetical protein